MIASMARIDTLLEPLLLGASYLTGHELLHHLHCSCRPVIKGIIRINSTSALIERTGELRLMTFIRKR